MSAPITRLTEPTRAIDTTIEPYPEATTASVPLSPPDLPQLPPKYISSGGDRRAAVGAGAQAELRNTGGVEAATQHAALGNEAYQARRWDDVIVHLTACVDALRGHDDAKGFAVAFNQLGEAFHYKGNLAAARPAYEEALRRARNDGDRAAQMRPTGNLGYVLREAGKPDWAIIMFKRAAAIAVEREDKTYEGECLGCIDNVEADRGNFEPALARLVKGLDELAVASWPRGFSMLAIGRIQQRKADLDAASTWFQQTLSEDPSNGSGLAFYAHAHLGFVSLAKKEDATAALGEARKAVDAQLEGAPGIEATPDDPWPLHYSALIAVASGAPVDEVMRRLDRALTASSEKGLLGDIGQQYAFLETWKVELPALKAASEKIARILAA